MSNADLLKELRIDRREPPPSSGNRRWIILAAIAVPVLLVGGWWLSRDRAIEVHTVTVTAIGGGAGGATSVLDATGVTRYAATTVRVSFVAGDWRLVAPREGRWDSEVVLLDPDEVGGYRPLRGR